MRWRVSKSESERASESVCVLMISKDIPVAPTGQNVVLGADYHGAVHGTQHLVGLEARRHGHLLGGGVGVQGAQPQATWRGDVRDGGWKR